ncbi:MAG: MoxR family ATPase, partial [Acidobacteria bacterium]|nr:MoxR family ATPase [Acidobacteriota bacterium]
NRAQDSAIVKPMSSALINRMVHVQLKASHRDWLEWAGRNSIHPLILEYLQTRPDHLWSQPPKTEEPFSTPRSWHILSDALQAFGESLDDNRIEALAYGCLTPHHATQFKAFVKQVRSRFDLAAIMKGELAWPERPEDRDVLYFLSQSFRAQMAKELPAERPDGGGYREFAHRAKGLLKDLAAINLEIAQMVVATIDDQAALPSWFLVEVVRDLPRLVERKAN